MKEIYIFDGISSNPSYVSLTNEIEKRTDILKNEFLQWVYLLGKVKFKNKTIIELLAIDNEFSLWWASRLVEKHPGGSKYIYKIFKLRTIEMLVEEKQAQHVVLISYDKDIFPILKNWAKKKNLKITIKYIRSNCNGENYHYLKKFYYKLPTCLQAFLWILRKFKQVFLCKRLSRRRPAIKLQNKEQLTIITYFPNFDTNMAKQGKFISKYWGHLPELIKQKYYINWIFFYFHSNEISFKDAIRFREIFNKNAIRETFFLLEDFCDWFLLLKVIIWYLKFYLNLISIKTNYVFSLPNSDIDFYNLCKKEWKSTLYGASLISSIYFYFLFKKIFMFFNEQKLCLFPCEMQGWERILCCFCSKFNIKTIGFQHSFVKPLNLRWFQYPKLYQEKIYPLFIPDILAVNSELVVKYLLNNSYPADKIYKVEALRYLYLIDILNQKNKIKNSKKILLVVTGYFYDETFYQLKLLIRAWKEGYLDRFDSIWIKPHPGLDVKNILKKFVRSFYKFEIKRQSLDKLFANKIALVFAANSTTASLEALLLKIPVKIAANPYNLNLSPLGNSRYLIFSYKDLKIDNITPDSVIFENNNIFYINRNLSRWKSLFKKIEMEC